MGATGSRLEIMPRDIQILDSDERFTRNANAYAYTGWHGISMSTGAKAVAKAAEKSNVFDPVVLVTAGERCSSFGWKLQRRIAEKLGLPIHVDEEEAAADQENASDQEVAKMIYKSLVGRKFLLIIDKLAQAAQVTMDELSLMGVPTSTRTQRWSRSKILITTPTRDSQVIRSMNIPITYVLTTRLERRSIAPTGDESVKELNLGGVDGLFALFHAEAGDVAKTLGISTGPDQVFDCFIYLCLFQQNNALVSMDAKEVMKYFVGEGFFINGASNSTSGGQLDGLDGAFKHVEGVLAELVSRYMVEERSSSAVDGDGKKFSFSPPLWKILNDYEEGRRYLKEKLHIQLEGNMQEDAAEAKWVSLSHNKMQSFIPTTSRASPWSAHHLSTLLLNDNPELKHIPDTFFHQIPNLKVLDLSRTSISSFPPSLSSLIHLRFLKLQECPKLHALPPSFKHLKQLIILDLRGTPLILSDSIPSEALEQKMNLRHIDLSHTNITHSLLPSLLSSFCNLNLERLLLAGCNAFGGPPLLTSTPFGHHHQLIRQIPELDISGCCGALKDVENVSFQDLPKLRALSLSHTPIARLSIIRCTSLETVRLQGLTNLKSLHLSCIKIKEFPHEISKLTRMEQLHLSDVKHLRTVDWEKVQWLPENLKWHQCSCCSESSSSTALLEEHLGESDSSSRSRGGGVAFISVNHASIFQGLSLSSPLWKQRFSKFHFYISPCRNHHLEQYQKKSINRKRRTQRASIYSKIFSRHLLLPDHALILIGRRRSDFSRYLEIEGAVNNLFRGRGERSRSLILETVVRKAEVLWLRDNGGSVNSLSDVKVEEMIDLKECWVKSCHNMEHLFPGSFEKDIEGPSHRLWVSELGSLKSVHDGRRDFLSLKQLHIQCCSKLDSLFPRDPYLPELETLDIRFCARLESVFGFERVVGETALPKLRALHLWELPKLKHICRGSLISLLHLRVRACPCLQRLPDLNPQKAKIKID